MPNYRFTHRECLLFVSALLMLECVLNIVYYDDIISLKKEKIQQIQHSNVSEVKDLKNKFQQLIKFSANISIGNETVRGVIRKRIGINYERPYVNATNGSMVNKVPYSLREIFRITGAHRWNRTKSKPKRM